MDGAGAGLAEEANRSDRRDLCHAEKVPAVHSDGGLLREALNDAYCALYEDNEVKVPEVANQ